MAVRRRLRCSWYRDESFAITLGFLVLRPGTLELPSDASSMALDCRVCFPTGGILRRRLKCGDLLSADRTCGATHDASEMGTS